MTLLTAVEFLLKLRNRLKQPESALSTYAERDRLYGDLFIFLRAGVAG